MEKFVLAQEEPVPSTSMYAQYKVFELVHNQGIKVNLDGQGADELLCGYPRYFADLFFQYFKTFCLPELTREIFWHGRYHKNYLRNNLLKAASYSLPIKQRFSLRNKLGFDNTQFLNPEYLSQIRKDRGSTVYLNYKERPETDFFNQEIFEVFHKTSLPQLLRFADKNSMHFSVEVRLPFLDQRLVDFALKLAPEAKIKNGQTKYILRESTRGLLPEKIRTRKDKIGFVTPEEQWFQNEFFQKELAKSVNSPKLKNIIDISKITENTNSLDSAFIWRLINLDLWLKNYERT